jgi:hypothetical protein
VVQKRNDQMADILSSEFQRMNDGAFAWESICSAYLGLPGLRGFWPMTAIGPSGEARDLGGGGFNLGQANNPTVQMSPPGYTLDGGSSERLSAADASNFDIVGNEAYILGAYRGMTLGLWVNFESLIASTQQVLMSKWNTSGQRAYQIVVASADDELRFSVSTDGSAVVSVDSNIEPIVSKWYFIVGRFDPSAELAIFINDTVVKETTGVPATLHNSSEEFEISSNGGGGNYGYLIASMAFITTTQLPDPIIRRLYYRTRPLFQNPGAWSVP